MSQVDGRQYVGRGKSKQLARAKAAEEALKIITNKTKLDEGVVASKAYYSTPNEPQNAVIILNEVRPGLDYILIGRNGPDHKPIYTMEVEV